jgi:hypothetical protein
MTEAGLPPLRAGPVTASARLRRRGSWLEYASVTWMVAEAAAALLHDRTDTQAPRPVRPDKPPPLSRG